LFHLGWEIDGREWGKVGDEGSKYRSSGKLDWGKGRSSRLSLGKKRGWRVAWRWNIQRGKARGSRVLLKKERVKGGFDTKHGNAMREKIWTRETPPREKGSAVIVDARKSGIAKAKKKNQIKWHGDSLTGPGGYEIKNGVSGKKNESATLNGARIVKKKKGNVGTGNDSNLSCWLEQKKGEEGEIRSLGDSTRRKDTCLTVGGGGQANVRGTGLNGTTSGKCSK